MINKGPKRLFLHELEPYFWSKVEKTPACWIYKGHRNKEGYGIIRKSIQDLNGKYLSFRAHRFSWEKTNGPIPDGLILRHLCNNPSCVRPSHLAPGDRYDNAMDAKAIGRLANGERHGMAKLRNSQVKKIRDLYETGAYTLLELGEDFGVSMVAIWNIVHGHTYQLVPGPTC